MSDATIKQEIELAARRLADGTRADAVILFGSRARGDYTPDSDWDLCILVPEGVVPQQFTPSTLSSLIEGVNATIQLYPVRRSIFELKKGDPSSMSFQIAREGVALIGTL